MLKQSKKVIWVLQGIHPGDNAQARALASRIDGEVICKDLKFNRLYRLPNLVLGASTLSLNAISRQGLLPPWPDLVIATGKRSVPAARWIKRQARGQTRIVQLGRPCAPLSAFDLVITTPQYGLPSVANVIEVPLPFVMPRKEDLTEQEFWRAKWAGLRRPLIAVAIGNAKPPLMMGQRETRLLGRQLNQLAEQMKGSLLLIASPRTAPGVVAQIAAELSAPHISYANFDRNMNPYQAALANCERYVVTSDSVSMISELINTGKPVDVFELPTAKFRRKWKGKSGVAAWLSRNGIVQPPRDVAGLARMLIKEGYVGVLGGQTERVPVNRNEKDIIDRLNLLLNA